MKTTLVTLAVLLLAPQLQGQGSINPQCPPGGTLSSGEPDEVRVAQDACQKAIDLFQYVAPQLGAILAGGNPIQGMTGTLGGLGHFRVGLRVNALAGDIPEVDRVVPDTRGAQQSNYPTERQLLALPTADVAIGVFKGLPLLLSNVGGVDLLLSAAYLPSYNNAGLDIDVPGSFKLGLGAKIGILQESLLLPGVSLSVLTRELPMVNILGRSDQDELRLDSVRVKARSWRLVAGKSFLFIGAAAGVGQDSYDTRGLISVTVAPRQLTPGGSGGPIELSQKLTRTNVFGSLWFTAAIIRIVVEAGLSSGGEIVTYNRFPGKAPDASRVYGSIGLSAGF